MRLKLSCQSTCRYIISPRYAVSSATALGHKREGASTSARSWVCHKNDVHPRGRLNVALLCQRTPNVRRSPELSYRPKKGPRRDQEDEHNYRTPQEIDRHQPNTQEEHFLSHTGTLSRPFRTLFVYIRTRSVSVWPRKHALPPLAEENHKFPWQACFGRLFLASLLLAHLRFARSLCVLLATDRAEPQRPLSLWRSAAESRAETEKGGAWSRAPPLLGR